MLRTTLLVTLLLGLLCASAPAAQETAAAELLEQAREAVAGLRSASYKISTERRAGDSTETAGGVVRFEHREASGAAELKLSIDGVINGRGPGGGDLGFKVRFDGERVLAILGDDERVWRATAQTGGDILTIGERLVMRGLTSAELLARDAGAATVTLGETSEIGGVQVVAVECQHDESGRYRKAVWYLGVADHLPRQLIADDHQRGVAVTQVQIITELIANPEIFPALFTLKTPVGFKVEDYVSPRQQGPALLRVGSVAPDFSLKDPSGAVHKLSDYRGKLVVIDFWATWCPPCRRAMPLVQKLHERFAENDAVEVFGISTSERGEADPAGFMRKGGYTYGLLLNGETIAREFLAVSLPTFYVIGKDGKVLHAAVGFEPDLDQTIGALLDANL